MSAVSQEDYKNIPKKYLNPLEGKDKGDGTRVNGKDWKISKNPFRVKTIGVNKLKSNSWSQREKQRLEKEQYKARLDALTQEKEDARKQRIEAIKKKKEIKEEKERYERIATKMHAKRVERLRKREKRNKLLKER